MAETNFVHQLSPLDLIMPAGYVGALLIFESTQCSATLKTKLRDSLDLVCKRIPWLVGRVFPTRATDARKPALEIRWSVKDTTPCIIDRGALADTYEDLSRARIPLSSIPKDKWPTHGMAAYEPEHGAPVFAASFFRFADGKAVGLCIQGHHNAMDGYGFAEILNLWARCCANEPESRLPSFPSALERKSRLENALARNVKPAARPMSLEGLYQRHPEYSQKPPQMPTEMSACTSEVLTIAMSKIDTYKTSLEAYLPTKPSTNTVACALLWSAITRARLRRTPDLATKSSRLPMAVNGRRRLDGKLTDPDDPYLGNMVLFSLAPAELPAQDVSECSHAGRTELLADVCRRIAQAQSPARIDAQHINEVCSIAEGVDDHRAIFPGWELFGSRDLFITSWADLNMHGFDFGEGLGKPSFVRIPYAQADGNVIILPRKRGHVGVGEKEVLEVVIMSQRDDLNVLREDSLWET